MRRAYRDAEVARRYERERSRNLGQRARAALEASLWRRALRGVAPGSRILDVACGTGRLAPLFLELGALTGVDASLDMLGQARRHAAAFVAGDATRLPFRDASFDLVTSTRFVRHLDAATRARVFRELARVSRGRVIVELLVAQGLVWRTKRLVHSREWSERLRAQRPTDAMARGELEAAGLRVVRRHALIALVSQPHLYVCDAQVG